MKKAKTTYWFLSFIIVTYIYGKFQGGFISWFLFSTSLSLFVYLWLTVRLSLREMKIGRILPKYLMAGESLNIEIILWNRFGFPHPFLLVKDNVPEKLFNKDFSNTHVLYPWFRWKTILKYQIPDVKRGVYNFHDLELATGDLFGLMQVNKKYSACAKVVVYPKIYLITNWESRNPNNTGFFYSQNKFSEETNSVIGVRDYRYGDRISRIHWKSSAKNGNFMVKEFEYFSKNDFFLFINQDIGDYSSLNQFETAINLAAALSNYVLQKGFSIGLILFDEKNSREYVAFYEQQLGSILELLAYMESRNDFPLKQFVLERIEKIPFTTTILLLTPVLNQKLYEILGELKIRKRKVEVFLINKEINGNFSLTTWWLPLLEVPVHEVG